jgi:hypothetical protein
VAIGRRKLVYVLVTDKRLKYPGGRSKIAYIGTTKRGIWRIAGSAAKHAEKILKLPGVRSFEGRIVACRPRQKIATWRKLERGLLIVFRERYGRIPHCNANGQGMRLRDELQYFSRRRLLNILEELA